jgi:hypothetical protein
MWRSGLSGAAPPPFPCDYDIFASAQPFGIAVGLCGPGAAPYRVSNPGRVCDWDLAMAGIAPTSSSAGQERGCLVDRRNVGRNRVGSLGRRFDWQPVREHDSLDGTQSHYWKERTRG